MSESAPVERPVKVKDVAEYYGVGYRTVLDWKASGSIPFVQKGKVVRFYLSKVIEAIEGTAKGGRR